MTFGPLYEKLFIIVFLATCFLSISAQAADIQTSINEGVQWLESEQDPNGLWVIDHSGLMNAMAVQAFIATGRTDSSSYQPVLDRLIEIQNANGSWDNDILSTCEGVNSLIKAGYAYSDGKIQSAMYWIRQQQRDDGSWNGTPPETAAGMIGLLLGGESTNSTAITKATQYLLDTQNGDGYWGYYPGDASKTYITPSPVIALMRAGYAQTTEVNNALQYLKTRTDYDIVGGCWFSSAAFIEAGENTYINLCANGMKDSQLPDWGWGYPEVGSEAWYTSYSVTYLALSGDSSSELDNGMDWIENHIDDQNYLAGGKAKNTEINWCITGLIKDDPNSPAAPNSINLLLDQACSDGSWYIHMNKCSGTPRDTGPILWLLGESLVDPYHTTMQNAAAYLLNGQLSDGGWGVFHSSNTSHISFSVYAMLGLASVGYDSSNANVTNGLGYIDAQRNYDNWGITEYTALTILLFNTLDVEPDITNLAIDWLLRQQNFDGGWGELKGKSSNVSDTCFAILALSDCNYTGTEVDRGVGWLLAAQSEEGAWGNVANDIITNEVATSKAIWALKSIGISETPFDVNIITDKDAYAQGEAVEITVTSSVDISHVTGLLTNPDSWVGPLFFSDDAPNMVASFDSTQCSPPGTYTISTNVTASDGRVGYAVKSFDIWYNAPVEGDINGDNKVDLTDLAILARNWLSSK